MRRPTRPRAPGWSSVAARSVPWLVLGAAVLVAVQWGQGGPEWADPQDGCAAALTVAAEAAPSTARPLEEARDTLIECSRADPGDHAYPWGAIARAHAALPIARCTHRPRITLPIARHSPERPTSPARR